MFVWWTRQDGFSLSSSHELKVKQSIQSTQETENHFYCSVIHTLTSSFRVKITLLSHFNIAFKCSHSKRRPIHSGDSTGYHFFVLSSIKCRFFPGENVPPPYSLTAEDIQNTHLLPGEGLDLGWPNNSIWLHHCLIWSFYHRTHKINLQSLKMTTQVVPTTAWKSLTSVPNCIQCDVSKLDTACSCLPTQPVCDALCKRTTGRKEARDLTGQSSFLCFVGDSLYFTLEIFRRIAV